MRPGAGGKLARHSEAQKVIKTHQVEPDGTRGQILHFTFFALAQGRSPV